MFIIIICVCIIVRCYCVLYVFISLRYLFIISITNISKAPKGNGIGATGSKHPLAY